MGALINTSKLKSQIEQLEEDNKITVNVPQTFQYHPKLHQKTYDEVYDEDLQLSNLELHQQHFSIFQTNKKEEYQDMDDSRETPSWNIPQIVNSPDKISNKRNGKLGNKSQTKKKKGNKIIQLINYEHII